MIFDSPATSAPSPINNIVKLINNQMKLANVILTCKNGLTYNVLEDSLVKYASTIKSIQLNWKPVTNFLLKFSNLISLDLVGGAFQRINWNNIKNIKLLSLQILKVH